MFTLLIISYIISHDSMFLSHFGNSKSRNIYLYTYFDEVDMHPVEYSKASEKEPSLTFALYQVCLILAISWGYLNIF